jgi:hypothetical protein
VSYIPWHALEITCIKLLLRKRPCHKPTIVCSPFTKLEATCQPDTFLRVHQAYQKKKLTISNQPPAGLLEVFSAPVTRLYRHRLSFRCPPRISAHIIIAPDAEKRGTCQLPLQTAVLAGTDPFWALPPPTPYSLSSNACTPGCCLSDIGFKEKQENTASRTLPANAPGNSQEMRWSCQCSV